jgi:hypothetical protein
MNTTTNPAEITVDHAASVKVNGGFRSGRWVVTHAGIKYTVFDSIPAQCDLDEQTRRVQKTAARAIATSIKPRGEGLIGGAELAA